MINVVTHLPYLTLLLTYLFVIKDFFKQMVQIEMRFKIASTYYLDLHCLSKNQFMGGGGGG